MKNYLEQCHCGSGFEADAQTVDTAHCGRSILGVCLVGQLPFFCQRLGMSL